MEPRHGQPLKGNLVEGNLIGTDITGKAPLGNEVNGVIVSNNAFSNTIGGTVSGAGNTIAFNVLAGVSVESGTGDSILSNSIYSNGQLGIDLVTPSVPPGSPQQPSDGSGPDQRRGRRNEQRNSRHTGQHCQHSFLDPVLHQLDSRSLGLWPGTDADRLHDRHNKWPGKCRHLILSIEQPAGEHLGDNHGHQHPDRRHLGILQCPLGATDHDAVRDGSRCPSMRSAGSALIHVQRSAT